VNFADEENLCGQMFQKTTDSRRNGKDALLFVESVAIFNRAKLSDGLCNLAYLNPNPVFDVVDLKGRPLNPFPVFRLSTLFVAHFKLD